MQTPAEKHLIESIKTILSAKSASTINLLNIGAGKSTVIETNIASKEYTFTVDRVDVIDCAVDHPYA